MLANKIKFKGHVKYNFALSSADYWSSLVENITLILPKKSNIVAKQGKHRVDQIFKKLFSVFSKQVFPLLYMTLDTTTNFSWIFDDLGVAQAK